MSPPDPTLARLEALGADFLWVVYHDYSGIGHAKAVTRERFSEVAERGVTWAKANWNIAIDDELIPHAGFAADSGDFLARPDPATVVPVPYRPRVAQALADLTDDLGAPWAGDPRGRLRATEGGAYVVPRTAVRRQATPGGQSEISMRRGIDEATFGTRTVRTPWARSAVILSVSAFRGRVVR